MPNSREERIGNARVGNKGDDGVRIVRKDLVELAQDAESLLLDLLLVDGVPQLVMLGEGVVDRP
jgi:hypothetical protein